MLRPLLAFGTLLLAAFVLAPTVASVHSSVEGLNIHRQLPWQIWKWTHDPSPPSIAPPDCAHHDYTMVVNITSWPSRVDKDSPAQIGGTVIARETGRPVADDEVDVFLNATKTAPGQPLGSTHTNGAGMFTLVTKIPESAQAQHYHLVAHALDTTRNCDNYHAAWSDPEMDVTAKTILALKPPPHAVVGTDVVVDGQLVDDVGTPVTGTNVTVTVLNQTMQFRTDGSGVFHVKFHPQYPGDVNVSATFVGTPYYAGSIARTTVHVLPEDVVITGYDDQVAWIHAERSTPMALTGHVYLAPGVARGPLNITFRGAQIAPLTVKQDADGNFTFTFTAAPPQAGGNFTIEVSGGGLKQPHDFHAILLIPVKLTLDAKSGGLFSHVVRGSATMVDDTGAKPPGDITFDTPSGWASPQPDAKGVYAFSAKTTCGKRDVDAYYNGTGNYEAQQATQTVQVCGLLAMLPPWLGVIPWWGWLGMLLLAIAAAYAARELWRRHAPTVVGGPAMTLVLERPPGDEGPADIVGIGERVSLVARLEAVLPEGHRLRMGPSHALSVVPLPTGSQVATLEVEPTERGSWPLRAEIQDARGRVVTRRTVQLRVVRYAEEIERRYRSLKKQNVGTESDVVTPHEFEAWLRQSHAQIDPRTARALVGVFEEADYSPREAGRSEFLAYLAAEIGLAASRRQEVRGGAS